MKNTFIKIGIIFSFCLLYLPLMAQTPSDFAFAVSAGGTGTEEGKSIATDNNGNVYVAGYFKNTAGFGSLSPIVSAGNHDAFLAKYDSSGNALWVKRFGGTDNDEGSSVTTDNSGNVYYTGFFGLTADAGADTSLTVTGSFDIFLFKYDAAGNFIWAKAMGGTGSDYGNGLKSDGTSVYLTGQFFVTADFGGNSLTSNGQGDGFVAKISGSGSVAWAKKIGSISGDLGKSISLDNSGNVYVSGSFSSTATFYGSSNITLTSTGQLDVFTAKFDNSGNVLWAKKGGGSGFDYPYGVDLDPLGNVFITGYYNSTTATFGTTGLSQSGNGDIYIVKYNNSGNEQWAKKVGAADYDYAYGITADKGGNVIVTGGFGGTVAFGSTNLTSTNAATEDLFITKLDNSGNFLWAIQAGSAGGNYIWGNSVTTGINGDVFTTGSFEATGVFGSTTLISAGGDEAYGEDIFVTKIDQSVSPLVGLASVEANHVSVFPTLNQGIFSVTGISELAEVRLFNLLGKEFSDFTLKKSTGVCQVRANDLSTGIYFVLINDKGMTYTKKIVIKN